MSEAKEKLPLLKVRDLHVYYGAIHAIKGITLEVHQGEIVTLIGANGAGKSTTLNTIAGLLRPRQGTIALDGMPVGGTGASLPADDRPGKPGNGRLQPAQGGNRRLD